MEVKKFSNSKNPTDYIAPKYLERVREIIAKKITQKLMQSNWPGLILPTVWYFMGLALRGDRIEKTLPEKKIQS